MNPSAGDGRSMSYGLNDEAKGVFRLDTIERMWTCGGRKAWRDWKEPRLSTAKRVVRRQIEKN